MRQTKLYNTAKGYSQWRTPFIGLLCAVVLVILGVLVLQYPHLKDNEQGVNLLSDQDWSHFAGASTEEKGLRIRPLGRMIAHQDTSLGQPNPPINLRGPHLEVKGDVHIHLTMEEIGTGGSFRLYGDLPLIYDEWRKEGHSMDIEVSSDAITVRMWDGNSSTSLDMRAFPFVHKDILDIILEHRNNEVLIKADAVVLGSIPDHDLFDTGTLWFGVDAPADSNGWFLTALRVKALKGGKVDIVPPPSFDVPHDDAKTLRNKAAHHPRNIQIGTAVSLTPLLSDDWYRNTAVGEFGAWTPENSLKPQFIHPGRDVYSFEEADAVVDVALENDILVHGHTLVFGKANPEWMTTAPEDEREAIMVDHVRSVVSHFRTRVATWDVVNEVLSEKDSEYNNEKKGIRQHLWSQAMGEEYIDTAFATARAADPDAKLYLNDYGLENDGKRWDALLALVKRLKQRNVPIDGIGFESHIYYETDHIDTAALKRHIRILASLGLESRISEIDVYGDDPASQADQYAGVLKVCLSEPTCTSYTTWGITDAYGSTTRSDRYPIITGNSLLWDTDQKPKQAYEALQKAFE